MNEVLTAAEIAARFESEWILVEEPETDEKLTVRRVACGGTVGIAMRCIERPWN